MANPGPGEKKCKKCLVNKSRSQFYPERRSPDQLMARCKQCTSADAVRARQIKPHVHRKVFNTHLRSAYGISWEQWEAMLVGQDGRCQVCSTPLIAGSGTQVDHCHKSGRVRGLLCPSCNRTLGLFQDRPEVFKSFVAYLEAHNVK